MDNLFGSLFEKGVQKKKDTVAAKKKEERDKIKAEKSKARSEARAAESAANANNKKRKNSGDDLNPKNKKQKTGSDEKSKKVSMEMLRDEIRNIIAGVPVVGEEDIENIDDLNLDDIDLDSDVERVSNEEENGDEVDVYDTSKKGNKQKKEEEAEPEIEEDENEHSKGDKTLWMGNVSLVANKTKIIDFYKDCGKINDVRFLTQGQIKDSQVVFVEFKTLVAAQKALKKNGQNFLGRKIKLRPAGDKNGQNNASSGPKKRGNSGPVSSSSLFVKNLSFKTTEDSLREVFSECGEIATVRLPTFPDTGKPTGFGFVDFKDASGLSKALQMNRVHCLGRQLLLEAAAVKNKEDKYTKNNDSDQPKVPGSYNFGAKTGVAAPKPNVHKTFGKEKSNNNANNNNKPAKRGKKQYEPKKR